MTRSHEPFKLTSEIVGVGDFLLIRINHLQQTVVAVVSPLRHIGCYRLVRHNHRVASLGLNGLQSLATTIGMGSLHVVKRIGYGSVADSAKGNKSKIQRDSFRFLQNIDSHSPM